MSVRYQPNIIITGTPGCGKTSHSEKLSRDAKIDGKSLLKHYNISDFAKDHDCYDGYDEVRKSHIVDEDKLLDALEPYMEKGGCIIDWHCNDIFPERLIDLVVVLRTSNDVLYDRLKKRGYADNKIEENLDAEIMEVVLQEARDGYAPEIVIVLDSNDADQIEENVGRIESWYQQWLKDNEEGVSNELQSESESDSDEE